MVNNSHFLLLYRCHLLPFEEPPLDLNPIEYMWKSIRRVISTTFARYTDDMRNTIKEAFYRFTKKLGFVATWFDKLLALCFNHLIFVNA
jgi:transposase